MVFINKFKLITLCCVVLLCLTACADESNISGDSDVFIDTVTVELGEKFAYSQISLIEVVVDDTLVDYSTIGLYEANAIYPTGETMFYIEVVDTTSPVLELVDGATIVVEIDEEIKIKNIVSVLDQSSVTLTFADTLYETNVSGCLAFSESGSYANIVVATDESGNESTAEVTFIVGDQPVFSGVDNITLSQGSDVDYLSGVEAVDYLGVDITESIEVDSENVDVNTPGEYDVVYSVSDENGMETIEVITVTVEKVEEEEPSEPESETSSSSSTGSPSSSSTGSSSSSSTGSSSSSSTGSSSSSSTGSSSSSSTGSSSSSSTGSTSSSSTGSSSSSSTDSSSSSSTDSSSSSSTDSSSSSSSSSTVDTSTAYISSDALSYINAERVKLGLSELTYKSSLGDAAKIRAVEASTYFAHTRPDGSSPSTVYSGAGSFGECLAMGQTSAYSVVYGSTSWSTSTTHWTALMNSKYTYCAIAYYKGSDGIYYWAALLSNY